MMSALEEKVIEAVRGRTILYDTSHANYLKTKLKLQIWEEVAKEIGIQSGSEAKKIWEKLRHGFRDALRRQKQYARSGAAATTYKPWRYQKEMGFLQPFMANRKRETNLLEESQEDSNTIDQNLECEYTPEADSVEEFGSEDRGDQRNLEENLCGPQGSSRESSPTPPKKQKRKDNVALLLKQSIDNRAKRASERAAERATLLDRVQPPNDPLYYFFLSMYETAKRMPPSSQHHVRNEIYKTVTEMEARLLNISQTSTSQIPSYSDSHGSSSSSFSPYSQISIFQSPTIQDDPSSQGREESDNLVTFLKM